MSILSNLAASLHLLGKAIDPTSITKVEYAFRHTECDIDEFQWEVEATLTGSTKIQEQGLDVAYTQRWKDEGFTEYDALVKVYDQVSKAIENFHKKRLVEANLAEQAVMTVCSQQLDLGDLWSPPQTVG